MERLLIAGFGDIARRALPRLQARFSVVRLSRHHGFDLDRPETLVLEPVDALLHLAPPQRQGERDERTRNLIGALDRSTPPAKVVYVSTSGVYGDCRGELVDESREPAPKTDRARRRLDAERQLAAWCALRGAKLIVLRAPGIYAADRLPLERLAAGMPVLRDEDDVYTNHVHAEDLATMIARTLDDDAPGGTYNACDDSGLKMGDWFDRVADRHGLARPPRMSRAEAAARVPPALFSFMSESRRLDNRKLKATLGVRLKFPTVCEGLEHADAVGAD